MKYNKIFIFNLEASLGSLIKRDKNRKRCLGKQIVKTVYRLVKNSIPNQGILISTDNCDPELTAKKIIEIIENKDL